jgi:hypothetical protein
VHVRAPAFAVEALNKKEIYWGQLRVNEVEEALDDDDDDDPVKPGEPGADADGGAGGAEGARARKRAKRRHLATVCTRSLFAALQTFATQTSLSLQCDLA